MDETTSAIIGRITVRFEGEQTLPSGHRSKEFYDCARLTPNDLARLAAHAVGHLPPHSYDLVLGVAYNGVFFASALAGGREVAIFQKDGEIFGPTLKGKQVLICSDVVVSGEQLTEATRKAEKNSASVVGYACIVDRSASGATINSKPLYSAWQSKL